MLAGGSNIFSLRETTTWHGRPFVLSNFAQILQLGVEEKGLIRGFSEENGLVLASSGFPRCCSAPPEQSDKGRKRVKRPENL